MKNFEFPLIQPLVLSLDNDGTLLLEDSQTGKCHLNLKLIPIMLWCKSMKIPMVINTKRSFKESAQLLRQKYFEEKTLSRTVEKLIDFGIHFPYIIMRYDTKYSPTKGIFFHHVFKAMELEIIQTLQKVNAEFDAQKMPEAEREGYVVSNLKELVAKLMEKNKEFENSEQAQANSFKQVQMKFLYDTYAQTFSSNFIILHLDDDNKIIDGLKTLIENSSKTICEAEGLPDKMSFLSNVIPFHFDEKDNTNEWQREMAKKLKLEEVALNFLAVNSDQMNYPLEIKMAILLYLHQNSFLVPDDKKSFITEQIEGLAKELSKASLISKDLTKFFFYQIGKEYPKEKVQSVIAPIQKVDANLSKPSFWQRLLGSANSPTIKVTANQDLSVNKGEIQNPERYFSKNPVK